MTLKLYYQKVLNRSLNNFKVSHWMIIVTILIALVWVQPCDESSTLCERDYAQSQQQKSQVSTNTCVISICVISQPGSFVQYNSSLR